MLSPLLTFLYDVISLFVAVAVTLTAPPAVVDNEHKGEQTGEVSSVALHGSSPQAKA
jgi:hypothetical protein